MRAINIVSKTKNVKNKPNSFSLLLLKTKCLKGISFNLNTLVIIAIVYRKQGKHTEAEDNLKKVLKLLQEEDINYAKECLNTILNDFNKNFNKTYVLNDIIKLDKSYLDNNIIIYNLDTIMHNTTNYLNKPYKISFKVDNNIIELINIT